MALIKCPECGKQISDKSKQCVNCGYPLPNKDKFAYLKDKPSAFTQREKDNDLKNKFGGKYVSSNIIKCPTCGSTDTTKISTTSKVINASLFGLLGNKRKKTFHCNNCKYEW